MRLYTPTYSYILLHTPTYSYILLHTPTYSYTLLHTPIYFYTLLHTPTHSYTPLYTSSTYSYILLHTPTHSYIRLHTPTYAYIILDTPRYSYIKARVPTTLVQTHACLRYISIYMYTYICSSICYSRGVTCQQHACACLRSAASCVLILLYMCPQSSIVWGHEPTPRLRLPALSSLRLTINFAAKLLYTLHYTLYYTPVLSSLRISTSRITWCTRTHIQ
jgi:hypothetical protein